ncbi:hypothetical protein JTB14_026995 [Gonioctena quinquepunctata]|nr:hypothetical protein JTB14_026995 [Gonioctena quinquepunctata]
MEAVIRIEHSSGSKLNRSSDIDLKLCILCQTLKKEPLVEKSKSLQILLNALKIWHQYEDKDYSNIIELLERPTLDKNQNGAKCYKNYTHRVRLQKIQNVSRETSIGEPSSSRNEPPTTRSRINVSQLNKKIVFLRKTGNL